VRSFILGLLIVVGLSVTILSMRPGGLRRQLRFAARRLRIFLVLAGAYVVGSGAIRLLVHSGPVADYGPIVLAIVLGVVLLVMSQDPAGERR